MAHAEAWVVLPRELREEIVKHGTAQEIGVRAATLGRAVAGKLIPADAAERCTDWYAKRVLLSA